MAWVPVTGTEAAKVLAFVKANERVPEGYNVKYDRDPVVQKLDTVTGFDFRDPEAEAAFRYVPEGSVTRAALDASVAAALAASRLLAAGDPVYRKAASNAVMASPPTITQGTTATISGQVIDLRSTTKVRWVSGVTTSAPDGNWIISRGPRKADGSFDLATPEYYQSFEFMADCAAFELRILAFTTKVVVLVDGERHAATQTETDNSGASRYVKVDFGGRRSDGMARRIQVTLTSGYLRSLAVGATDSVYPVADATAPLLAILGDSYGTAYASRAMTSVYDGYPQQLARLLGFRVNTQNCAGGTGYVATSAGGGAYGGYLTRVSDVVSLNPDMVLVQGSINDYVATPSALEATARNVLETLRAGLPKAVIVATGVLDASPTSQQGGDAVRSAAIASAAASAGVLYLDTAGWVTGTGKAGATTGDGNADVYTYSDGSHPTVAGGYYLAARLAGELRNRVMALASVL